MNKKENIIKLEPVYTVEEVALYMKCTPQHIYSLIKKGTINAIKFGGFKIKESELLRIINEKTK